MIGDLLKRINSVRNLIRLFLIIHLLTYLSVRQKDNQKFFKMLKFLFAGYNKLFAVILQVSLIIADAVSPAQARTLLVRMTGHHGHRFLNSDLQLGDPVFDEILMTGHRQVTDAYLLGLALRNKAKLATFDRTLSFLAAELGGHVECLRV